MSKNIEVVKEKIKKLLAMAEDGSGASQSEIESAIKVARKLMFEYKISDNEMYSIKEEIIRLDIPEISFSTVVNPWALDLINIIANNYGCFPVQVKNVGAKTRIAGIFGSKDDVEIVKEILLHAYNAIISDGVNIRKTLVRNNYTNKEATSAINAYGNGFVCGIRDTIIKQNEEEKEEFSLVLSSNNIKDKINGVKKSNFNTSKAMNDARKFDMYAAQGYVNGRTYTPNRMIA